MNELVPEKLLMELYGPPFAAAVQHAAGVMCAYNRVNGVYACENPFTLKTMLKGRYNFSGYVCVPFRSSIPFQFHFLP